MGLVHITFHPSLPAWSTIISPGFLFCSFYPLSYSSTSSPSLNSLNTLTKNPHLQFSAISTSSVSFKPPYLPGVGFPPITLPAPSACSSWGVISSCYLEVQEAPGSLLCSEMWGFSLTSHSHNSTAVIFVLTVHSHLCLACPRTSAHPPPILSFLVSRFSPLSCKPSTGHHCSLKPLDAIFRWGSDFAAIFSGTSSPPYLDSWVFLWIFF